MAFLCARATDERVSRRFYHVFARRLGSLRVNGRERKERTLSILSRAANAALVVQPIRCKERADKTLFRQRTKQEEKERTHPERRPNNGHSSTKSKGTLGRSGGPHGP